MCFKELMKELVKRNGYLKIGTIMQWSLNLEWRIGNILLMKREMLLNYGSSLEVWLNNSMIFVKLQRLWKNKVTLRKLLICNSIRWVLAIERQVWVEWVPSWRTQSKPWKLKWKQQQRLKKKWPLLLEELKYSQPQSYHKSYRIQRKEN